MDENAFETQQLCVSTKKKTRRRKKTKCQLPTMVIPKEGAGFKDNPYNGICVNGKIPGEPDHILEKDALDKCLDAKDLLEDVLRQNVGVSRSPLLSDEILNTMDLKYLMLELEIFLKNCRRLNIYSKLAFQEAESIFKSNDSNDTYCPKEVYHILYCIILKVVPTSLLGSRRNWKVLMGSVKRVAYGSHHQYLSLSSLVHGLKVSDIFWLQRALLSNSMRLNVLASLVKWLICWVQIVILRLWHVVKNSSGVIVFYNRCKWYQKRNQSIQSLVLQGKIEKTKEDSNQRLRIFDIGSVRFLPKSNGMMRPICYFRKTLDAQQLQLKSDARILLTQLAHLNGSIGTFISPSISEILRLGLIRIVQCHPDPISRPHYYFVRVDVKDAFGSVNHRKLFEILTAFKRRFLPSDYKVQVVTLKRGRREIQMFESEKITLPKGWCKLKRLGETRHLIPILKYIRSSVCSLGIDIGKHVYWIKDGIPQGMHLSAILSEIYYSSIDAQYFSSFQQNRRDELFMRYCDDYLFLTPSEERGNKFLETITQGIPEFNFQINPEKTQTNLRADTSTSVVSFCGYTIDSEVLSVQANLDCYRYMNMSYTQNLSHSQNLGNVLRSRMKYVFKLYPILLDKRLNSKHTIAKNIYNAALLMAFRFFSFIRSCFPKTRINQKFIVKCVKLGEMSLRKKVKKAILNSHQGNFISFDEIKWIVYRAFLARIRMQPCKFEKVKKCLEKRCGLIIGKLKSHQSKLLTRITTPALEGVFTTMK